MCYVNTAYQLIVCANQSSMTLHFCLRSNHLCVCAWVFVFVCQKQMFDQIPIFFRLVKITVCSSTWKIIYNLYNAVAKLQAQYETFKIAFRKMKW